MGHWGAKSPTHCESTGRVLGHVGTAAFTSSLAVVATEFVSLQFYQFKPDAEDLQAWGKYPLLFIALAVAYTPLFILMRLGTYRLTAKGWKIRAMGRRYSQQLHGTPEEN